MRIFISYSSHQRELAERLELALSADDRHEVFRDRSDLAPGRPFDETLREAIENCDLLVFLVSPDSVAPGSYALAELGIAQRRWRHPGGHVLPVVVAPTPIAQIPAYLKAVTLLEPRGEVVAETLAAIEAGRRVRRPVRAIVLGMLALVLVATLGVMGWRHVAQQRADDSAAGLLLSTARQLCDSGDHALAWQRFDEAVRRFPARPALREARQDCGMRWLREIHVTEGKGSFTAIVEGVLPVLAEGAAATHGERAADLHAHLGWADFLRIREGAIRLDPAAHYRQALAEQPSNVYAHAMWGHYLMSTDAAIAEARGHFDAALAANRERAYVRGMQFAAMLWFARPAGQVEALRIANDMRRRGETAGAELRERLWSRVYYDSLMSRQRREGLLSGIRDADPVATFRWLYPESEVRPDRLRLWRFFLASLEEAGGDRQAARSHFEALRDELQKAKAAGPMLDDTRAALQRLSTP
ncbi:MAG TPA: toll/interleukin-1 receptor domain-containing protein [Albitalea sp.]|uniref:toll/interleukin-1 receptor domain-containing protein n=1 Tax=Piscinibacter sp. TaxID=1903157 RepID=UPI002ED00755